MAKYKELEPFYEDQQIDILIEAYHRLLKLPILNSYGFRLDISHPVISRFYRRFKEDYHIPYGDPLSDKQRKDFELWVMVRKVISEIIGEIKDENREKGSGEVAGDHRDRKHPFGVSGSGRRIHRDGDSL